MREFRVVFSDAKAVHSDDTVIESWRVRTQSRDAQLRMGPCALLNIHDLAAGRFSQHFMPYQTCPRDDVPVTFTDRAKRGPSR